MNVQTNQDDVQPSPQNIEDTGFQNEGDLELEDEVRDTNELFKTFKEEEGKEYSLFYLV